MDIGAILSRAMSLYRGNLKLILPYVIQIFLNMGVIFGFVMVAGLFFVVLIGSIEFTDITDIESILGSTTMFALIAAAIFGLLVLTLITVLISSLTSAAVIGMVADAEKNGRTTLDEGIKSAKKHGVNIFIYYLVISFAPLLVLGAIGAIVFVLVALLFPSMESIPAILFLLAFFLFSMLVLLVIDIVTLFVPQKIVIEGHGAIDGIKASFAFVKKHPVAVVIYIAIAIAVFVALNIIMPIVFTIPTILLSDNILMYWFFTILNNALSVILPLLVAPYFQAVKTLMVMESEEKRNEAPKSTVLQAAA